MKIKIIQILAIAGLLGFAGCKPKPQTNLNQENQVSAPQIKVEGQMFIVTQGAENIKLGDVEVLLLDTTEAKGFLQKKESTVESIIQSRKQEFETASNQLQEPEAEYNLATKLMAVMTRAVEEPSEDFKTRLKAMTMAQEDFDSYFTNSPYATSNDFIEVKKADDLIITNICARAVVWAVVNATQAQPTTIENSSPDFVEYKHAASEIARSAQNQYDMANSHLSVAEGVFDNSPTPDDYLGDFRPTPVQKTITDADGKFSFAYPSGAALTIFAHAQRLIGTKTEQYYWLVNAPTNGGSQEIFLSNHNLVTVDPDGYFKIKPK